MTVVCKPYTKTRNYLNSQNNFTNIFFSYRQLQKCVYSMHTPWLIKAFTPDAENKGRNAHFVGGGGGVGGRVQNDHIRRKVRV